MTMGLPLPAEDHAGRPWGQHLVVDLYGCDLALICDGGYIAEVIGDLVKFVGMTAYGPLLLERFALDNPDAAGYSAVQLITTSSITAHFAEGDRTAYIDLFSCKGFDALAAAWFIANRFGAERFEHSTLVRGRHRV